jgi:hypothetical protein
LNDLHGKLKPIKRKRKEPMGNFPFKGEKKGGDLLIDVVF